METGDKGILVYCQQHRGSLLPVGLELLGEGRRLARILRKPLYAAIVGDDVRPLAETIAGYGAAGVYFISHPQLACYTVQAYTAAMQTIVEKVCPDILLIGATTQGRDLSARLAARLDTGLTADCTQLAIDPQTSLLLQTRPAYGGNVEATVVCPSKRPQMATVRPGVFPIPAPDAKGRQGELMKCVFSLTDALDLVQVVGKTNMPLEYTALAEADIIVSCGRGVENEQGVALARELATALGGMVGASRKAVEYGLLARIHQVGQTGQTVRPQVYIACGISGAVQHLAGMHESGTIIAINNDPEAPIFKVADYGICSDLFTVLPALIKMLARDG